MIKSYIKSILTILTCLVIFNIYGCKSDNSEPTAEQIMLTKISKNWKPAPGTFVTLDGQDVSINFQDFNITLNDDKNYVSVNGNAPIWPVSGFYEFEMVNGVKNLNRIIREDGAIIDITEISEKTFQIEFFYDPANLGGRSEAVQGKFAFNLVSE